MSSQPRWTPGPWRVDSGPTADTWQVWAATDEPTWIADVWTTEADASLIAAAPEMYEALRATLEYFEVLVAEHPPEAMRPVALIRKAIAKAEGTTTPAAIAVYLLFGLVVWSWCAMAKELEQ